MKEFFTIREFARLRNINVNSMRYYEKLGLLKPAYTDENTGYRYYKADQLAVLDKIILCINLGIPLKEMVTYIDESGTLHSQKLLEHGRKVAKNKMNQLQNTLNFIDFSLKSIEENKEYKNREDWYIRKLDQRRVAFPTKVIRTRNADFLRFFLRNRRFLYYTASRKICPVLFSD